MKIDRESYKDFIQKMDVKDLAPESVLSIAVAVLGRTIHEMNQNGSLLVVDPLSQYSSYASARYIGLNSFLAVFYAKGPRVSVSHPALEIKVVPHEQKAMEPIGGPADLVIDGKVFLTLKKNGMTLGDEAVEALVAKVNEALAKAEPAPPAKGICFQGAALAQNER